jgi:hypothetical protein
MNRLSIRDMIDRRIVQFFRENMDIPSMQIDISKKIEKFSNTIREANFDVDVLAEMDYEKIYPPRMKYATLYIKYSKLRIAELEWILQNKHKFEKFSYFQVYKLVILREKLSKENATFLPF